MNEQVEVRLDFINNKGKLKHVKFYMDEQSYKSLFDESISEEVRNKYLVDVYHEYERERYYNRKLVSLDTKMEESLFNTQDSSISSKESYLKELKDEELKVAISKLTPKQQEIVKLIYWEGKTQGEVAAYFKVGKQAINNTLARIYIKLKENLQKNKKN